MLPAVATAKLRSARAIRAGKRTIRRIKLNFAARLFRGWFFHDT